MSIDNFGGERVQLEDCTDEELEGILADTNRYYPADQSTGMEYGRGYWQMMRDQAAEIQEHLDWLAREGDRREMRNDDDRIGR